MHFGIFNMSPELAVPISALAHAVELVPLVVVFRAIPLVGCFLCGWRCASHVAFRFLSALAVLTAVAVAQGRRDILLAGVVGHLYFACLALSLCSLRNLKWERPGKRARSSMQRGTVFCVLFALYVAVPALMFAPGSDVQLALVAWGWERALAAYSYTWNSAPPDESQFRRAADLFFLSASPELVFPGQTRACAPEFARGGARVLWGATLLSGAAIAYPWLRAHALQLGLQPWAAALGYGCLALLWFYGAHSGLAHVQIGLLRTLGLAAPERYHYPLWASTPSQFWRRWNTYVGSWVRVYLYTPMMRKLASRHSLGTAASVATISAFTGVGALHALYVLCIEHRLVLTSVGCFGCWGGLAVVCGAWEERARRHFLARLAFRVGARAAVLICAVVSAWVVLDAGSVRAKVPEARAPRAEPHAGCLRSVLKSVSAVPSPRTSVGTLPPGLIAMTVAVKRGPPFGSRARRR